MNLKQNIIIALLAFGLCGARAAEPKWFAAPAMDQAPNLDLGLDDPAWAQALKIPFAQLENGPGDTTKYPTESYWLYANGSLFVAFQCVNPDSPKLWVTPNQMRDQSIYTQECVELFLGDFDGGFYYQLVFDAAGNIFDSSTKAGTGWNGDWKCQVTTQPGYWTAVIEIPAPILATLWTPGSFLTLDVTRHGFNPDGSGEEVATISPPGVHSPEDRVFLGSINPALLGENLTQAMKEFKKDFAKAPFTKEATEKLASLDAFATECGKAGDVTLERYRELHSRYVQSGRELAELKRDIVLDVIFGNGG
ncbi:MAG: hypothetical protein WCS31_12540 [Verrucomicrobiae bacterium]